MMNVSEPASPYVRGNFGPVSVELTEFDLPVTGAIPGELDGRYLRNGPNPIGEVTPDYHWFTGDGMVHGIRLRGGRAEWYRNRYVRSPVVTAALDEPSLPNPFDESVQIFGANTNIIGHSGRTFAIVEAGSPPIELTTELDTLGPSNLGGTLEHPFSAHPKLDPATGELHVATYFWGWGNVIRYLVVGTDGRVRHSVDIECQGGTMIHDIGMSEKHIVIMDLPCIFDLDRAMAGSTFPYAWSNEYRARMGVLPKDGKATDVMWFDIDPCYVFHPLNTFDRTDGAVVMDAIRHPRMFDKDRNGPNEGATSLSRFVLDPSTGRATEEQLDDRSTEFPRTNETVQGREYRYGYAVAIGDIFDPGDTVKYDIRDGHTETLSHGPGRVSLEPVFVPREGGSAEDDGWLMQVVYDSARDGSDLVISSAQDLAGPPVATVTLPQRVPFGFHGNWVPTGQ